MDADMPRYRFAEFTVSTRRRLLLRSGRQQSLIPRYFDLLVLLLERRDEAVSRQRILDEVWSDVTVSEGALNQAVRSLRRLLGDDPRNPRFIRTVPRFGYQFVSPDVVEEGDRPSTDEDPSAGSRRVFAVLRRRGPAAVAGGTLAGVVGGAVGALLLWGAGTPAAPLRLVVVFAFVGALIGALGAAGVAGGILTADAVARGGRFPGPVAGGSLGGGLIGASAHLLASWTLEEIFGHRLSAVGGGLEGLLIGAAVGLGYAFATRPGALARRRRALLATPLACALATVALTWIGRPLGGVSLDAFARAFDGSHAGLAPLARLFGEPQLVGACEGLLFGAGTSARAWWPTWCRTAIGTWRSSSGAGGSSTRSSRGSSIPSPGPAPSRRRRRGTGLSCSSAFR